jgi:hypothetical protein
MMISKPFFLMSVESHLVPKKNHCNLFLAEGVGVWEIANAKKKDRFHGAVVVCVLSDELGGKLSVK